LDVILLVDDIRDHAVNYEAALTRHGFKVRVATSGEEALRVAREMLPDCAVIDLRLPDMTGWELCREIKRPQAPEERVARRSSASAAIQYYFCKACRFCWRAEALTRV